MTKSPLIFVALSGGVDSAVVAHLLKKEKKQLIGISHIVWPESKCCSTVCLDRCREQCVELGIPYYSIDCIVPFCKKVIDPFVEAYFKGITPNPCILCNQKVRFDEMVKLFFEKHPKLETSDYKIATGHYVQIEQKDGLYVLKRGVDHTKDQSYMLYRLNQEQLAHCLFPLGKMKKSDVKKIASDLNLSSAKEAESQDICFVTQDSCADFISQYTETKAKPGKLLDKSGKILGEHQGIINYTRGQRKGLGLADGPWYVLEINASDNSVVLGRKEDLAVKQFKVKNLIESLPGSDALAKCKVQTRYHALELNCQVKKLNNNEAVVELEEPYHDISPGQSAVFYDNDFVLGGGEIVL